MRTTSLAVAAAAVVAYLPTLANRYTFDDVYIVERDRLIRSLAGIPALFHQDWWAPFGRMGLYRPLAKLTFALGWVAAPASPAWYHLVNILLHAVAAVLVLRLARRWLPEGFATAAALWFALVPTQVEVVAGLVGRADLLAVVFALAALLAFVRAAEERIGGSHAAGSAPEQSPGRLDIRRGTLVEYASACLRRGWRTGSKVASDNSGTRPKPGHAEAYSTGGGLRRRHAEAYFIALWAGVFTFCSLLSKESGIVLPGLAVLAGWGLAPAGAESFWQRARRVLSNPALWTTSAAAVAYLALRVRIVGLLTRPPDFADNALWYLGAATRVRTALVVAVKSFGAWLWPFGLAPDYSWPQIAAITSWASPALWASVAAFVAVGVALWRLRRHAVVLFGAGFALLSFLPVSNLLFAIGTIRANRLLYLPSVGAALLFGWLCQQAGQRWGSHAAGDGTPVEYASACRRRGLSSGSNRVQTRTQDAQATRAERRRAARGEAASPWSQPRTRAALLALALLLAVYAVTDLRECAFWKDNATLFAMGVARSPDSSRMRYSLGVELQHEGHLHASVAELRRALALYPRYGEAAVALGDSLKQMGQDREALAAFQDAWSLKRDDASFLPMADEELKLGDNAAVLQASRALSAPLDPMAALAVGLAQLRLGQFAAAVATLAPVVRQMPENARAHLYYGQALHQLGRETEARLQLQWLAQHAPAGRP